jgi:hypothetical protein
VDCPRWAARTVRQGTADCLHPCHGLSVLSRGPSVKANRTSSSKPRNTDRPRGARGLSARHPRTIRPVHANRPKLHPTKTQTHDRSKRKASKNTKNTRRTAPARTVCRHHADCPPYTDRTEKLHDLEGQLPQIIIGFPKRLKLWRQGFGDLKSVTQGCYRPKILPPNSLNHRESRIL